MVSRFLDDINGFHDDDFFDWPEIAAPTLTIGGGGYVAKAVHFDGTASLSTPSLGVNNGPVGWMSIWIKQTVGDNSNVGLVLCPDNFRAEIALRISGVALATFYSAVFGQLNLQIVGPFPSGSWCNLICAWNTNAASGDLAFAAYINDVKSSIIVFSYNNFPFDIDYSGSAECVSSASDTKLLADASDYALGFTNLLEADGTISETNRRKFISSTGKPVNPSGFPSNTVLFSGDSTTFATNQGTGGTFTLTGVLTNATTSPSD